MTRLLFGGTALSAGGAPSSVPEETAVDSRSLTLAARQKATIPRSFIVQTVLDTHDTILAIATASGHSPRGMIRISGVDAFDLVAAIVISAESLDAAIVPSSHDWRARGISRARLRFANAELPVLLLSYPGPASYTGEDSVEILTVGNPYLLNRLIDELIAAGRGQGMAARRAEPGEFTARAYFNNKMTLTQAEGVAATISARSDAELRAGALLMSGRLGSLAHELADDLANALALVEAGIDFTDQEDVVAIMPGDLLGRLQSLNARIDEQLARAVGFEELRAIPWVVLTGPPNAGKSTLFNHLLGRTRAVISDMPGTTRDVLTESLHLATEHGDAEVMLVDIAGVDDSLDWLNQQMQQAAADAIDRAELILHCHPADAGASGTSNTFAEHVPAGTPVIHVLTKADLPGEESATSVECDIRVSATESDGLEALKRMISSRLEDNAVSLAADALALRPRHEASLREARGHLAEAIALLEPVQDARHLDDPEIIAATMRGGLDSLALLAGDMTPDDVLGRVFATFCVGK